MKKALIVLFGLIAVASCQDSVVEKPDNLIEKDRMIDIIYDLSILEAIKSTNYGSLESRKIDAATYVYKKYKIDSLQFAKSDHYYASDIDTYSEIYDRVSKRLENSKKAIDSTNKGKLNLGKKSGTLPQKEVKVKN